MIGRILDAYNAFINVFRQPDSERKGQLFEEALIESVFIEEIYDFLLINLNHQNLHVAYSQ